MNIKNDFADWLSPMLVKELRQGVRSRAFVSTFILLQVAMLLTMMTGLLTTGDDAAGGSTIVFWVLVGVSVLLILPLSGLNAVGGEIKANTLELIFLTHLTSLRIVTGKWLAIFTSSVLLVSAVLPYLVLRYFIGGVNIATELIALFSMLAASALLIAIAVGLSPYQTRIARGLIGIFVFFLLQGWAMPFYLFGGRSPTPGIGVGAVGQLACLLACGLILLLLMLDVGASKIAPSAENHSAIKRSLALAALAVAGLASCLRGDARSVTIPAFILAGLVCVAALCEQPRWIPSIHRPFAARGFFGRFLGRLLYPGWHTGVWFTSCIFVGFAALMAHLKMLDSTLPIIRLTAVLGTLLLPAALTQLFFPKTDKPLVLYFSVQAFCLITTVVCGIIDESLKTSFKNFVAFLPVCALIQSVEARQAASATFRVGVPLVTFASWITLLASSRRPLRRTRALEKESLQATLSDGSLA